MISLRVSRLPLINQRLEYNYYRRLIRDDKFRAQFAGDDHRDFECGKFVWAGIQEGATVLVQRILLGIEARIPNAVALELSCRNKLTVDILEQLKDPYALGGRSTAECYYNRAPALIEARHALAKANPELWGLIRTFYKQFRNPIFHGSYLSDLNAEKLDYIFSVFDEVYGWCDGWCDVMARINEVGAGKHGRP